MCNPCTSKARGTNIDACAADGVAGPTREAAFGSKPLSCNELCNCEFMVL